MTMKETGPGGARDARILGSASDSIPVDKKS